MAAIGGSPETITISGREFPVTQDADPGRDLGGYSNEIEMNGNGTARTIKTRMASGINGVVVEIDDDRDDQSFLQNKRDEKAPFDYSITYASGATWQGRGTITGDLTFSAQAATATFSIMGGGKLTKQ